MGLSVEGLASTVEGFASTVEGFASTKVLPAPGRFPNL